MKYAGVYMTMKNKAQARHIGRTLVKEHLAACVNIIDNMESIYWWNGRMNNDHEVVMAAKTRMELVNALTSRVKKLHTYECPCVVAYQITGGNEQYLRWIKKETKVRKK